MVNSLQFTALFSEFGNAYLKHVASIFAGNDLVPRVIGVVSPISAVLMNALYGKLGSVEQAA